MLPVCAYAEDQFTVEHYTTANGLIQNSITGLALDTNGFLWIGTQGGLCRFDGKTFRLYNSGNTSFSVDRIADIDCQQSGALLVRLGAATLPLYQLAPDFSFVPADSLLQNPSSLITPNGYHINLSGLGPAVAEWIRQGWYQKENCIGRLSVSSDQVYTYTQYEINYYDMGAHRWSKVHPPSPLRQAACTGNIFLGLDSSNKPVYVLEGQMQSAVPATAAFRQLMRRVNTAKDAVKLLFNTRETALLVICGELWLLGQEQGLLQARQLYESLPVTPYERATLYDEQNDLLFAGTATDGLYIIRRRPFRTILPDRKDDSKNIVYSQVSTGERFFTTRNCLFNPVTGQVFPAPQDIRHTAYLYKGVNEVLFSDTARIYFSDSLMRIKRSIPYYPGLTINPISAFLKDAERIWFSCNSSLGYLKDDSVYYVFRQFPGLKQHMISVIFPYSRDILWLGTHDGIIVYNKATGELDTATYLPDHEISTISRSRNGSIWVSTYGKGFYKYHRSAFVRMPVDEKKYLLFAHSLNEDRRGFFWIPTNNGLFQCSSADLESYANRAAASVYYYHYADCGQYTNEFNRGALSAALAFDHLFLMASMKGVVRFAPDSVKPLLPNGHIIVEDILCDGRKLPVQSVLALPAGFDVLQLKVAAPYLGSAENCQVEYVLGNGNNWLPLPADGLIILNQLHYGNYQLRIRKQTGFGTGNYTFAAISIQVAPFWYETSWFFVLIVLAIAGAVLLLFRQRSRALRRRNLMLERSVQHRTADLLNTVQELNRSEQNLSRITQEQERVISIIVHDVQTPLGFMSGAAAQFGRQFSSLSSQDIEDFARAMERSAQDVHLLTGNLLQWLKQRRRPALDAAPVDLAGLLHEVAGLYSGVALSRSNILTVASDNITAITDREKLILIIRNLTDNAVKHTRNGYVRLSAIRQGAEVIITVADNGKGMSEAQAMLLQDFVNSTAESGSYLHEKLGYALIREFLKPLGGRLMLDSIQGKGTTVQVSIPIGAAN